jgi:hypothetical protein
VTKITRLLLVVLVAMCASSVQKAWADIDSFGSENVQEGDNEYDGNQGGESQSGDAVAGQVTGSVSAGDTSIDATNHSKDVDITSGDASAANSAGFFTGLNATNSVVTAADILSDAAFNVQEGDNATENTQAASASTGDGVGGQVIGVVTSAGGSADVVAANTSDDIEIDTGDADVLNAAAGFVGHNDIAAAAVTAQDINGDSTLGGTPGVPGTPLAPPIPGFPFITGAIHEGDNDGTFDQSGTASSGDGVGGQVIGAVTAGDTSIDATNASEDVEIDTGDAEANNSIATFVGSTIGTETVVQVADIIFAETFVAQEGDNAAEIVQASDASSGDGVGGQIIGAVTSASGSADIVAANSSEDVGIETGDAEAETATSAFVGQNGLPGSVLSVADIIGVLSTQIQEGDNDLAVDQSAIAQTGDGVGGQVLGVVSAGDASVDATNLSRDVDVETGDALAEDDVAAFVGQSVATDTTVAADILNGETFNVQEGDNAAEVVQAAEASTGDAVAGQIGGVVTSAGGSADLVLANTSEHSDTETGESFIDNEATSFTGLNAFGEVDIF